MADMFRTGNPALNENAFNVAGSSSAAGTMTIQGTVNKAFVLLLLVLGGAAWVWSKVTTGEMTQNFGPLVMGGLIGGVIFALATIFKKEWSAVTAPGYAICEGLVLGGISAIFEMRYPGIVIQAVALTLGVLASLLMAYTSGLIKATENFKLGVFAATGGIALVYLADMILRFFGHGLNFIHQATPLGIGISVFVVIIASLNLVLDFDFIEQGSQRGAPKYMEWYGAFGLMVTLIWLYLEILRLLSKLRDRH